MSTEDAKQERFERETFEQEARQYSSTQLWSAYLGWRNLVEAMAERDDARVH
jgi:hypothetical protein